MTKTNFSLQDVSEIALQAGDIILDVYEDKKLFYSSRLKKEKSPYTIAKLKADEMIVAALKQLDNSIPIISENHNKTSYYYRKDWEHFWLVDALNGTREFLKRSNEFTINLALIEKGKPVLGVIYAPASKLLYAASTAEGAYKINKVKKSNLACTKDSHFLTAVTHLFEHVDEPIEKMEWKKYPIKKIISAGSTLKFCRIAEGFADIYYRHSPSMEWETAAGEAIVEISGGMVKHLNTKDFRYNKQMLKNKSFICVASSSILKTQSHEKLTL